MPVTKKYLLQLYNMLIIRRNKKHNNSRTRTKLVFFHPAHCSFDLPLCRGWVVVPVAKADTTTAGMSFAVLSLSDLALVWPLPWVVAALIIAGL